MIPTYHPGRRPTAWQQIQWTGSVLALAAVPRAVRWVYDHPWIFVAGCIGGGAAAGALAAEWLTRPYPRAS